jgi:hypothetical protein
MERLLRSRREGKMMVRSVFVAIAALAAVAASPLGAQQQPAPPPASELPPPVPPASTEPPPPFPHFPTRAPREHDPNYHPGAHARGPSHHRAKVTKHHAKATHHHARAHHNAKRAHHSGRVYFSKRTIRQCHAMSYKQIMAHKYCRTMMKQDLATAAPKRHHAARHHRSAKNRNTHRRRR